MSDRFFDIAKNTKVLEELKSDLLSTVATLYKAIVKGTQEKIIESLAAIIILTYLIGKRLGVKFFQIDKAVEEQLHFAQSKYTDIENWFNDISSLKEYINDMNNGGKE